MVRFDAREPGTAEEAWHPLVVSAPALGLAPVDELVVIAPHADDETLGAGGLIARAAAAGASVTVVLVTDGAAGVADEERTVVAAAREDETRAALAELTGARPMRVEVTEVAGRGGERRDAVPGPASVRLIALGVPDGQSREHRAEIAELLADVVADIGPGGVIAAPWIGDGHRDHRVVGEIAEDLAAERGLRLLRYPVWFWHWGDPAVGTGELERMVALELDDRERTAKRAALGRFPSQTAGRDQTGDAGRPLGPPMLSSRFLAHFDRPREIYVEPVAADRRRRHFEQLHLRDRDPWDGAGSWYERRKRALTLAALPQERYARVLELGSSVGHLTAALAERADRLVAIDFSHAAVSLARLRTAGMPGVEVRIGDVRDPPRDGPFDLVVLSEVGYYLEADALAASLGRLADGGLGQDAALVACHARGRSDDMARTGDEVHEQLRALLVEQAVWRETEFVIGVYSWPPR